MKVGLVIYGSIDQKTGGYLYDRMLAQHIQNRGHELEIISVPRNNYLENIKHNFKDSLQDKLSNPKLDILLQDELCHPSLFHLNNELKKKFDYPIVSIVHNLSFLIERKKWRKKLLRYFETKYLQTVDGFIFNSQQTEKSVKQIVGETSGVTARPGKNHIDIPSVSKNKEKGVPHALFVGNMLPNKGLDILIKALTETEKFILTVAGDDKVDQEYTDRIKDLMDELSLNPRISIRGLCDYNELSNLYQKSDLLVVPSYHEGFGIVYIEAMGHGVPVIATKNCGAKSVIDEGEECFLIEPGKIDELVSYLILMEKNPEILDKMGKKARKRYEKLSDWEESMERVIKHLESLISTNKT